MIAWHDLVEIFNFLFITKVLDVVIFIQLLLGFYILNRQLAGIKNKIGSIENKITDIKSILGSVKNKVSSIEGLVGSIENKVGSIKTTVGGVAEGVTDLQSELSYHERQCAARHEEFIRQLRAIAASRASEAPPAAPQQD